MTSMSAETLPEPLERGRYAVFPTPDGGWAIARCGPLCETCAQCRCGDQAEPVLVPAFVVQAMMTGGASLPGPVRKLMGMVSRNGGS